MLVHKFRPRYNTSAGDVVINNGATQDNRRPTAIDLLMSGAIVQQLAPQTEVTFDAPLGEDQDVRSMIPPPSDGTGFEGGGLPSSMACVSTGMILRPMLSVLSVEVAGGGGVGLFRFL